MTIIIKYNTKVL